MNVQANIPVGHRVNAAGHLVPEDLISAVDKLRDDVVRNIIANPSAYGVEIAEGPLAGLTARAVVVLDGQDNVLYSELVNEITTEPDYDAALAALK